MEIWLDDMEHCTEMPMAMMDKNISRARRLHKEYERYIEAAEGAFALVMAGKKKDVKKLFQETIEPLTDNVIYREMEEVIQQDSAQIDLLYDRVLQHNGTLVFYADQGREHVRIAKTAVNYFLAVDEVRMSMLKQIKEIIDYQLFHDMEEKYDFVRYGHDASNAIEKWQEALAGHRELGMEGESADLERSLEMSELYGQFQALSHEALAFIDNKEERKGFDLVNNGIEHFLDEVILVNLERDIEDSQEEMRYAHAGIRDFTVRAGIRIGILIILLSGITLYILIRVVRQMLSSVNIIYKGTVQIGAGNLDYHIDLASGDEFEVLSGAVNAMTGSLRKTTISRNYLDDIIASIQDGIFIIDENGMIKKVNGAACDMLGYEEQELVSMHITGILEKGFFRPDEGNTKILESLRGKKEKTLVGKDGRTMPVMMSGSFMHDRMSAHSSLVCVAKDISEIKASEEHLMHLTQKLIAYSENLEEANEDIRSFSTIVSHDMRAPLRNVNGFSKQLMNGADGLKDIIKKYYEAMDKDDRQRVQQYVEQDIRESLEYIATSVDRMDGQINAILNP